MNKTHKHNYVTTDVNDSPVADCPLNCFCYSRCCLFRLVPRSAEIHPLPLVATFYYMGLFNRKTLRVYVSASGKKKC